VLRVFLTLLASFPSLASYQRGHVCIVHAKCKQTCTGVLFLSRLRLILEADLLYFVMSNFQAD
jgi:hypothetical protein